MSTNLFGVNQLKCQSRNYQFLVTPAVRRLAVMVPVALNHMNRLRYVRNDIPTQKTLKHALAPSVELIIHFLC